MLALRLPFWLQQAEMESWYQLQWFRSSSHQEITQHRFVERFGLLPASNFEGLGVLPCLVTYLHPSSNDREAWLISPFAVYGMGQGRRDGNHVGHKPGCLHPTVFQRCLASTGRWFSCRRPSSWPCRTGQGQSESRFCNGIFQPLLQIVWTNSSSLPSFKGLNKIKRADPQIESLLMRLHKRLWIVSVVERCGIYHAISILFSSHACARRFLV